MKTIRQWITFCMIASAMLSCAKDEINEQSKITQTGPKETKISKNAIANQLSYLAKRILHHHLLKIQHESNYRLKVVTAQIFHPRR